MRLLKDMCLSEVRLLTQVYGIHFQPVTKGAAHRLASGLLPFLFDRNKELWTELGPAVNRQNRLRRHIRSIRRVLPKITSLHEVTAAGTPK